jgi:hypothetical protein
MRSASIVELMKALGKFQSEIKAIPKTQENPFFKSKFAPLPQIVEAAQPYLQANNLVVKQDIVFTDGGQDALSTLLMHTESGEFDESTALLHLAKSDPQAQASAVTYLRRYAYVTTLGLQVDKDDDGAKGTRGVEKEAEKKQDKNKSIDLLRAELSKKFSVPSERKAFIAKIVGQPTAAEDMTEVDIVRAMTALADIDLGMKALDAMSENPGEG